MYGYLLGTDVVSKMGGIRGKNIRCWLATIDDNELYLSAITVFEITRGIQKRRQGGDVDKGQKAAGGLRRHQGVLS